MNLQVCMVQLGFQGLLPQGLYPYVWVQEPWNKALNNGIWDPTPRALNPKPSTNLESWRILSDVLDLLGGSGGLCKYVSNPYNPYSKPDHPCY